MNQLRQRPWYLWIAFAIPAFGIFLQSVAPFEPTFKAQNLAVWLGILGALLVLGLWLFFKKYGVDFPLRVFLVLLIFAWLYQNVLEALDGRSFNHTTYFLPLLLLLIYWKTPGTGGLLIAGLVLGYCLVAIIGFSLVLGGHFGIPNGFNAVDSGPSRFPFFSEFFGIENRWGGPFSSVNIATPAGGLLIMLGILYRGWNRTIFILVGVLVLFLSQARTTYFALSFALLILFVWSAWLSRLRFGVAIRWALMAISVLTAVLYIAIFDPTLALRTPVWSDYLGLVKQSVLRGVGTSGVNQYLSESVLNDPSIIVHEHGHSVYLDGLTRYGIVWLFLTLAVFAVAFYCVWKARNGYLSSRGPAIVTFIFFAALTETIFSWAYVTIYLLALVLVVGLASESNKGLNVIIEDNQLARD